MTGARNTLRALLDPGQILKQIQADGDYSRRLALMEELKAMSASAVWNHYCQRKDIPDGLAFMDVNDSYEGTELSRQN
jgi:L-rhamnose isomerase